jgi:hypothetical protein
MMNALGVVDVWKRCDETLGLYKRRYEKSWIEITCTRLHDVLQI